MNRIGSSIEGADARTAPVFDPASGEQTAEVVLASVADVDIAVGAAATAWTEWRDTSLTARARILFAFRELVDRHREDLARLITAEHGKVTEDARGEVARGLEVVEFACGIPHLLKGEFSEDVSNGIDALSVRQPLGVVAGITPFNFPVMVPMWMYPVSIACGNAFVLKPSERDPSPSVLVADLWQKAGLPEGVFTVVNGDAVAVDALIDHPAVAGRVLRRVDAGGPPRLREGHCRRGPGPRRWVAPKTTPWCCPTLTSTPRPTPSSPPGYGSAGERCMAVSAVVVVGDGDPLVDALPSSGRGPRHRPRLRSGIGHGATHHPAHRDRVAGYPRGG